MGTVRYAGVEYEGRHKHLIDAATFAKAGAVLAAHNHATEKNRKHHHYLKGSLYCGRCGLRMSLIPANGNGGRYPSFFCIGRMKGTGCEQPYVPVDLIETAVERAYGEVRIPRKQAEVIREKLNKALTRMRTQAETESTRQRRRIAKLTEEREKLLHAYYVGAVPIDLPRQEQDRSRDQPGRAAALAAPGHLRRQWNQALFERLLVYDDDIETAEVTEPPSRRWLTLNSLPSWMVRPPRKPPLPLAAVQMKVFSSGRQDKLGSSRRLEHPLYHLGITNQNRRSADLYCSHAGAVLRPHVKKRGKRGGGPETAIGASVSRSSRRGRAPPEW